MTSISKNVYIDKLDHVVNKDNNTYHRTTEMKPVDIKSSTYIDSSKGINYKDPKFKIGDIVRISKYKNIFAKGYLTNWSEVKNTLPRTYVISDLKGEEIVGTLYEKELRKTNEKQFRVEKVIKRKGDKLYVKWICYNSSFNSWIYQKDIS